MIRLFTPHLNNHPLTFQTHYRIIQDSECARGNETKVQIAISRDTCYYLPQAHWWAGFENKPTDLENILKQQGLNNNEAELAVVSKLDYQTWPQVASFLTIKKVDSVKLLSDMISVICNLVPTEAPAISKIYSMAEKPILNEGAPIKFYVGYIDDGIPISTCSIFLQTILPVFTISLQVPN